MCVFVWSGKLNNVLIHYFLNFLYKLRYELRFLKGVGVHVSNPTTELCCGRHSFQRISRVFYSCSYGHGVWFAEFRFHQLLHQTGEAMVDPQISSFFFLTPLRKVTIEIGNI